MVTHNVEVTGAARLLSRSVRVGRRVRALPFAMCIQQPLCDGAHELNGRPCFSVGDVRKPGTAVTSASLIPQGVYRTSEIKHRPLNSSLGRLTWLDWMLRSYQPHCHIGLAKKTLEIGATRVGAKSFNKNVSGGCLKKIFASSSK